MFIFWTAIVHEVFRHPLELSLLYTLIRINITAWEQSKFVGTGDNRVLLHYMPQ